MKNCFLSRRRFLMTVGLAGAGAALAGSVAIQVPVVNHDLCIGCGLCEFKCPVVGNAAIRVRVDPML